MEGAPTLRITRRLITMSDKAAAEKPQNEAPAPQEQQVNTEPNRDKPNNEEVAPQGPGIH